MLLRPAVELVVWVAVKMKEASRLASGRVLRPANGSYNKRSEHHRLCLPPLDNLHPSDPPLRSHLLHQICPLRRTESKPEEKKNHPKQATLVQETATNLTTKTTRLTPPPRKLLLPKLNPPNPAYRKLQLHQPPPMEPQSATTSALSLVSLVKLLSIDRTILLDIGKQFMRERRQGL